MATITVVDRPDSDANRSPATHLAQKKGAVREDNTDGKRYAISRGSGEKTYQSQYNQIVVNVQLANDARADEEPCGNEECANNRKGDASC